MKTSSLPGLIVVVASLGAPYACAQPQDQGPPARSSETAGASGSAGTHGTGTAGTYGTGTAGTYGTGTAGTYGTGTAGTYGTGTAGAYGTGTAGAGATAGTTGATSTAGASGVAGAPGGAGTAGAPGGATTCDAAWAVQMDGFVRAPAYGAACWHGYAFLGGDATSTITPKDFSTCGASCALKLTGTVGAAVAPSYAGNAFLGFNLSQASGSMTPTMITPTGTNLVVTFTNTSAFTPLRVQVVSGTTFWCHTVTTSPATIPYAMMNTACWDNSGTFYAKQPITSVQLSLPGGMTATTGVSVTLVSVTET